MMEANGVPLHGIHDKRDTGERVNTAAGVQTQQASLECSAKKGSLQARYLYGFIFLITNLLAWVTRDYAHKAPSLIQYIRSCGAEGHDCFHSEGVLRVSFGCFAFFSFMFVTTFRSKKLCDTYSIWHSSWWTLKLVIFVVALIFPFFMPVKFIRLYGETARLGAGIFLFLQLISVIQFINWWNDYWMPDAKLKQGCILGLFMSTIFYIASICGIGLMYMLYAPGSGCTLNVFFITWTAILLAVMMLVSLNSKGAFSNVSDYDIRIRGAVELSLVTFLLTTIHVNRGLLSSGIMGSYVVFLCWSAIRSEPLLEKCSPQQRTAANDSWTTVIGFLIAVCAIVMSTFSTGIDSESFKFQKQETQSEDDIPYHYGFFHFVFAMGAMYFAMLFISWDLHNSNRKWSIDVGWASTWIKIVNEWFAATIYLWTLISPLVRVAKVMDHEDSGNQPQGIV